MGKVAGNIGTVGRIPAGSCAMQVADRRPLANLPLLRARKSILEEGDIRSTVDPFDGAGLQVCSAVRLLCQNDGVVRPRIDELKAAYVFADK